MLSQYPSAFSQSLNALRTYAGRGVSRAKWEPKKGLDRMVIPLEEGRITLQRRAFESAEGANR